MALLLGALLVAAACGGTVAPTPSPTPTATATPAPTPTPTATPSPTPAPTPSPSASKGPDPTEHLQIGEPYALTAFDPIMAAAFEAAMKEALGSMSSIVQVGAVEVVEDGKEAGFLIAIAMPGFPGTGTSEMLDSIVGGAVGSSGAEVEPIDVDGHDVRLVHAQDVFSAFQLGELVIFVYGTDEAATRAITEALIAANP